MTGAPDAAPARRRPSVVVCCYSQTGQLRDAAAALTEPLQAAGWDVRWAEVVPRRAFPFPWPVGRFFGVFPETAGPAPAVELERPPPVGDGDPDLVIFAFQVWYLAPSPPMRAVPGAVPGDFAGRDVVGLVACRNMWYSAALETRRLLTGAGARYLGTVAATDTAPTLATIVTTLRWLLRGRKEAFWRFPAAGVGAGELARLRALGRELAEAAAEDAGAAALAGRVRDVLAAADAAPVDPAVAAADLAAARAFRRWGRIILLAGRRAGPARPVLLAAFAGWLGVAIALGLPALALLRLVARRRFDRFVGDRVAPVLAVPGGGAR